MQDELRQVLNKIHTEYKSRARKGARHYLNVNIGNIAEKMGFTELKDRFSGREVVVTLNKPQPGMKVRIDGRTFVNYVEFEDGFAVPEFIAKEAGFSADPYHAGCSMILNFT